jgi:hypothetical protein
MIDGLFLIGVKTNIVSENGKLEFKVNAKVNLKYGD